MVPAGFLTECLEAQQLWDRLNKSAGQQEQRKEKKKQPTAPDRFS